MTKREQELELELARARRENEDLLERQSAQNQSRDHEYTDELRKIQRVGEKTQGNITYKDIHHATVTLWRRDGKRIGPLHPANAEATLKRFFDAGVLLSTGRPTEVQIETYKKTPEYKKIEEAQRKKNIIREKSRKPDQIQKLAELLTQNMGVSKESINSIKKLEEVGAGR